MFGVTGLRFRLLDPDGAGRVGPAFQYAGWSVLYLLGHAVGAAAIGAVLGWVGSQAPILPQMTLALGIVCLFWTFQEALMVPNGLPQWHRQVQRHWVGRLPWALVALGYGAQLGAAVLTRIRIRTTYAALLCAFLVGSAEAGMSVMVAFGVARALPALIQGPFVPTPDRALRFAVTLDTLHPKIVRANAVALLLAGAALVCICFDIILKTGIS